MSEARTSSHHMPQGLHHIPPSSVATVMWPGQVLAPALARQDAQCAGELLLHGQIVTDARSGSGQTHGS